MRRWSPREAPKTRDEPAAPSTHLVFFIIIVVVVLVVLIVCREWEMGWVSFECAALPGTNNPASSAAAAMAAIRAP